MPKSIKKQVTGTTAPTDTRRSGTATDGPSRKCAACRDTGFNSKGGPCRPCELRGRPTITEQSAESLFGE